MSDEKVCDSLLLGACGSVGVTTLVQQILTLRNRGLVERVRVMMSRSATRFLTPYALRLASGGWVFVDDFQPHDDVTVPHIQLTRRADLFVVMPATANMIGKAAHGICDDLISSAIVASTCPVVFVPSMNEAMWTSPAVTRNVETLRALGHHCVAPSWGIEVADLGRTYGAMPPLLEVVSGLRSALAARGGRSG